MVNPNLSPDIAPILSLLREYSFDIDNYQPDALISQWLDQFGPVWVGHAITEALYQGRYKVISVDYILQLWQRRGAPLRHFNREFESIILGQTLLVSPEPSADPDPQRRPDTPAVSAETETTSPPLTLETLATWPPPDSARPTSIPNFRPLGELAPIRAADTSVDTIPPFVPRRQTSDLHQRLQSVVHTDLSQ